MYIYIYIYTHTYIHTHIEREILKMRILEVVQGVEDAAGLALVGGGGRGTGLLVLIGGLHEGGELRGVRGVDEGGLHHHGEGRDDVVRAVALEEGGAALGHLALDDAGGARDHVDDRHELLLLGDEVGVLRLTHLRGGLEVGLVRGDGGGELLDLGVQGQGEGGLLVDRGLQRLDLRLAGLDLEAEVLGAVLAPLGELRVELLGLLALRDDLALKVADHLDDLADRADLGLRVALSCPLLSTLCY